MWYELKKSGNKHFHVFKRPNVTIQQREDRLWFCGSFLKEWDVFDFHHLVPSDDFLYIQLENLTLKMTSYRQGT